MCSARITARAPARVRAAVSVSTRRVQRLTVWSATSATATANERAVLEFLNRRRDGGSVWRSTAARGAMFRSLWQHPYLDIPERHHIPVVLEPDVALRRLPVLGPLLELALVDPLGPIRAPQLVLQQLLPVEPVLDVVAPDHDAGRVPFSRGLHHAARRGVQPVVGAGRGEWILAVGMGRVIEHLHFGGAVVDELRARGGAVEEAAVPPGRDLPVHRELEVPVSVGGDDVAAAAHPGEGPDR